MSRKWLIVLLPVLPVVALIAADDSSNPATPPPVWSTKAVATWSQDDAQQLLTDSPWVKSLTPSIVRGNPNNYNQAPPMRRRGGFGGGPFGYPGGGYPQGGGGYPGGYPPNQYPQNAPPPNSNNSADDKPPKLTLRWESALPVRQAELKVTGRERAHAGRREPLRHRGLRHPRQHAERRSQNGGGGGEEEDHAEPRRQERHEAHRRAGPAPRGRSGGSVSVPETEEPRSRSAKMTAAWSSTPRSAGFP